MSAPSTPRAAAGTVSLAESGPDTVTEPGVGHDQGNGEDGSHGIVSEGADVGASPFPRDPHLDESFDVLTGSVGTGEIGHIHHVKTHEPGSPAPNLPPAPPRVITTPELKLRRPAPKQSSYHVVIKQRTPSPEPETPPPSNPETESELSDSEEEDEIPPSPPRPPAPPCDERLFGKKLRLDVLGAKNVPIGLGDVFLVVECGQSFFEATPAVPPSNPKPKQSQATSFEIYFDDDGASNEIVLTAMAEGVKEVKKGNEEAGTSGVTATTPTATEDDTTRNTPTTTTPVPLARVTIDAYDLLPSGELDPAYVARLGKLNLGDWMPMVRNRRVVQVARRTRGASVPIATTSVNVVCRVVDAGHLETWQATEQFDSAIAEVHKAASYGSGDDAVSTFEQLITAFSIPTLPDSSKAKALGGGGCGAGQAWLKHHPNASAKEMAVKCLNVAWSDTEFSASDKEVPRTVLARAAARPTPDGTSSALAFLNIGSKPSEYFSPFHRKVTGALSGENQKIKLDGEKKKSTPVHCAATSNSFQTLEALLQVDAESVVGSRDGRGYTPLHVAIVTRSVESVKLLMRFNSDPFAQIELVGVNGKNDGKYFNAPPTTSRSVDALTLAAMSGNNEIIAAVFDVGKVKRNMTAATDALFVAARLGNAFAATKAIALGADVAKRDVITGRTCMETAASCGSGAVVQVLHGASKKGKNHLLSDDSPADSPRAFSFSHRPFSAIEWAAYSLDDDTVRAVLETRITVGDEWKWAGRVADTRGGSLKTKRMLRGRVDLGVL